jgi:hypothetical protein
MLLTRSAESQAVLHQRTRWLKYVEINFKYFNSLWYWNTLKYLKPFNVFWRLFVHVKLGWKSWNTNWNVKEILKSKRCWNNFNVFCMFSSLSPRHLPISFNAFNAFLLYSVHVFQVISTLSPQTFIYFNVFHLETFNVYCPISTISTISISTSFDMFQPISVQNISVSFNSFNIFHRIQLVPFQHISSLSINVRQ